MSAMAEEQRPEEQRPVRLTQGELRRRRVRNWALLLSIGAFVLLVYLVSLVKMGFFE